MDVVPHIPFRARIALSVWKSCVGIPDIFRHCYGLAGCSYLEIVRIKKMVLDNVMYRIHVVGEFDQSPPIKCLDVCMATRIEFEVLKCS